MINCDLLIVTAPYTETNYPLQAPAIIKASVVKNGYTANTFDINNVTKRIIPTKILEYMACGKPVITTPLLGIKEFFPQDGFGVLFSNSELFHESVINLITNPIEMEKMGLEGTDYVKNNLDWEKITKNLLNKFELLIQENKINN